MALEVEVENLFSVEGWWEMEEEGRKKVAVDGPRGYLLVPLWLGLPSVSHSVTERK